MNFPVTTLVRLVVFLLLAVLGRAASAQDLSRLAYDIGSPPLADIWVDPARGDDSNSGASRSSALRTVTEAWNRIPDRPSSSGYRIMLAAGRYSESAIPAYWENKRGTHNAPVILQGADGRGTAVFNAYVNIYNASYVYLIDFDIEVAGEAFHCERCDHLLLRGMEINGGGAAPQTVKVNQSQHFYVEGCDISGANENSIDYVAVQYGHIVGNKLHDDGDWCIYVKGGSGYFVIQGNEIYNCGTGGFSAGQGTGFEYMVSPWLHYEAHNIKFINNIIYDTEGAGFGVNGSYNILLAHNTMYRVGSRSHGIEVVFGARSCDGNDARCAANNDAGGWGPRSSGGEALIPSRSVYILNNILYNPPGFRSAWQHFAINGPVTAAPGSNIPSPVTTDQNLVIRGNLIFNGPADLPLGVEDAGCADGNPGCNASQLRRDNSINTIEPQFVNAADHDFRPRGASLAFAPAALPQFAGDDRPAPPLAPQGNLENIVELDFNSNRRETPAAGALLENSDPSQAVPPSAGGWTPPSSPEPGIGAPSILSTSLSRRRLSKSGGKITLQASVQGASRVSAILTRTRDGRTSAHRLRRTSGRSYSTTLRFAKLRGRTTERYAVTISATNSSGSAATSAGSIIQRR